jgi:hypothetical protein
MEAFGEGMWVSVIICALVCDGSHVLLEFEGGGAVRLLM